MDLWEILVFLFKLCLFSKIRRKMGVEERDDQLQTSRTCLLSSHAAVESTQPCGWESTPMGGHTHH